MNIETAYESLCIMDERNPLNADVTAYEREPDEPIPGAREKGCACDSCFYGKDSLAVEIIRLQEKLKKGATQ